MVEEEEEDGARAVSNGRAMWWTPLAAPHECRTCVLAARGRSMASAGRGWWSDVDGSPWGAQTTADALVRDYRSDSRSVAERGGAGCGSWAVHVRSDRRGANLRVCGV